MRIGGSERRAVFARCGRSVGCRRARRGRRAILEHGDGRASRSRCSSAHVTGVSSLAFARDGKALAVGGRSRGNGLFVANCAGRQPLFFFERGRAHRFVRWSTSARILGSLPRVVSASRCICGTRGTGALQLEVSANCRGRSGVFARRLKRSASRRTGWRVSPVDDRHRRRSDRATSRIRSRFRATSAGLSPQLDEIAVSRDDGQIRLQWTSRPEASGENFQHFHRALERCGEAHSPDGALIATCEGERMTQFARANPTPKRDAVDLWDAATGIEENKIARFRGD